MWKEGLRIDGGTRVGKTIIFASSHDHAVAICKEFYKMLPGMPPDYCAVIDYQTDNTEVMKQFMTNPDSITRIAVSVDMLDTGVDIPCLLNLVFFKPVYSYVKFWQMIGRGTRPCRNLIDGEDKDHFLIFDFCGNFKAFDENPRGVEPVSSVSLTEAVFGLRIKFIQLLQSGEYQIDNYPQIREEHVRKVIADIGSINLDNYDIGTDRAYIKSFCNPERFENITDADIEDLVKYVAPHIQGDEKQVNWTRFDNLMLSMSVTTMLGNLPKRQYTDLRYRANELFTKCANLGQVKPHLQMIRRILEPNYLEQCNVEDMENIRKSLRKLMDLVRHRGKPYYTTLHDSVVSETETEYDIPEGQFTNFKQELRKFILNNSESSAIKKIHSNEVFTEEDLHELQELMWSIPGFEEEYQKNYADMPLPLLVRTVVGLDKDAAEAVFSKYLARSNLTKEQVFFVKEIITHVVMNGVIDKKKLASKPFTNNGNVNEVFKDDKSLLGDIIRDIDSINRNANYDGLKDITN